MNPPEYDELEKPLSLRIVLMVVTICSLVLSLGFLSVCELFIPETEKPNLVYSSKR